MRRMANTGPERLEAYRKRFRLKQFELADLLRMHFTTLSQVLAGKRRPGLDTALRIEELTGIPVSSWSERRRGKSAHTRTRKSETDRLGAEESVA